MSSEVDYCWNKNIKTEAVDDEFNVDDLLLVSPKWKCETEQNDSSCDQSSEFNSDFPCFPIKQEPEDCSRDDVHLVQTENVALKEEIMDIEEHKPAAAWKPIGKSSSGSNVGISKDEFGLCDSVEENVMCHTFETLKEEQRKYNCLHCSYKTNKMSYYMRHYNRKHKQFTEIYKCNECLYESGIKYDLVQHYKCKHARQLYKCQQCSFETKNKNSITQHFKCKHSTDATMYKCTECSYETKNKSSFTRHHVVKHSKDAKVYKCQECSFETKNKSHLNRHYKCKHYKDATVYKCEHCSWETRYKCDLTRHYKHKHLKKSS